MQKLMRECNLIIIVGLFKEVDITYVANGNLLFRKKYKENQLEDILKDAKKVRKEHSFNNARIALKRHSVAGHEAISNIIRFAIDIKAIHDLAPIPHNGCRPMRRTK